MEVNLNDYSSLIKLRLVLSFISLVSCLFNITLYIILLINYIFQKNKKNEYDFLSSFSREESISSTQIKGDLKIGLGTHYMFFLMITKLLWCILSVYQCIKYPFGFFYLFDKYSTNCINLGFFHNFLELSSICWTSIIIRIFLITSKINDNLFLNEKNELFKGFCFCIFLPLIITLLPLYTNSYGPAKTHCSFDYLDLKGLTIIWWSIINVLTIFLVLYNIYVFIKIISFYCKVLKKIKTINKEEYNAIKIFILVFSLFPFILIINTVLKGLNRYIDIKILSSMFLSYIHSIMYCLSGFFKSIPCLFFLRGTFKICSKKNINPNEEEISLHDMKKSSSHDISEES